jgi:hypothetical protein
MKKVALLIAMTFVLTSCSWLNDTPTEETKIPEVKVENKVETPDTNEEETKNEEGNTEEEGSSDESENENDTEEVNEAEETVNTEVTPEEVTPEESITEELANGTEDEQLLNEVFNEINEVFELVEQNGGQ